MDPAALSNPPSSVHVWGAGIAGAAAAHAFAARGCEVCVVAPNGVADGASGIPAAAVRPRLWRPSGHSVPDAEILADAVVPVMVDRKLELGADAVGACDEHGLLVTLRNLRHRRKTTEAAQELRAVRCFGGRPDAPYELGAGGGIYTRILVGQRGWSVVLVGFGQGDFGFWA